ncbi:MAG: chorismate mutase [Candidatus Nanoarchaeia archaeon]
MEKIQPLREELYKIDKEIIRLLEKRLDKVGEIWRIKKKMYIPLRDTKRETERIEALKKDSKLSPKLIEVLYQMIFEENERIHGK